VAKAGTSNPDRTRSRKRLQCVVENKYINTENTSSFNCLLLSLS